jgi:hypothetical protein
MTNALEKIFEALQKRLMAGLAASRSALGHPVARGDATEVNWIDLLSRHLPHRYDVAKAFVVDSTGAISDQIDIVVYDRLYTPLLYNQDEQRVIPAGAVVKTSVKRIKQRPSPPHHYCTSVRERLCPPGVAH